MCPLISPSFSLVNTFIFLSFFFLPHVSGHAEGYTACAPFSCGNFTGISYPFWSNKQPDYCGHPKFKLGCQQDNLTIDINSQKFHVIDINTKSQLLKIARLDLWNGDDPSCPKQYINVSLDVAFFSYTSSDDSCYLLFDCGPYNSSGNLEPAMGFSCLTDDDAHDGYLVLSTKVGNFIDLGCKNNITVPVLKQALQSSLPVTVSNVLAEGFEVGWSGVDEEKCDGCMKSAGRCGYNASQNAFMCLCGPNQQSNGGICSKTPALSPLPAPSRDASKHVAEKKKKLMGIAVGVIIFGFITCVSVMMLRKQVAMGVCYFAPFQRRQESLRLRKEDTDLPMFDLSIIVKATNNFSSENKLGEGGFGPVYKGTLIDGNEVAIKRHSKRSDQGLEEFKNEVGLIAKLQHRNLVKLLGCCIQGEEKLLIYEYMPNKSLDYFIFDETRSKLLAWLQRFHIIGGIARGLLYLHQDSRLRIIHRDLKTSNILLDAYMNPKISDFGLARTFRGDQIEAKTKRMVGTYGYMPPEYVMHGHYSVKSDVFSFGVIILEIVSGNKNKGFCDPEHSLNLLGHAWRLWTEDRPLELLDQHLLEPSSSFQVLRCIHVGLLCVQQEPGDRPDMPSVILMLNGEKLLPQPKAPGFYTGRGLPGRGLPDAVSPSSNQMSLTTFEAR